MAWLTARSVPDAGAFVARVLRLDPGAVVRLRPRGPGAVALWARLPFSVLVSRTVLGDLPRDVTVGGRELLAVISAEPSGAAASPPTPPVELPAARDAEWRWSLPPATGRVIERVPVDEVARLDAAAAATVRTATAEGVAGRAVGSRILRDALLDHVPIVITTDSGERVDVPQRLIQAVVRMGFLGPVPSSQFVDVRTAGPWVGLACAYGAAWYRPVTPLRPI